MRFLHRLFCKHHFKWLRNLYGDEIDRCGGNRSLWECMKCGKLKHERERYFGGMIG